ncbi:MAG: hypothetical protein OEV73_00330 [Desulfobulbaceae bacterium]|nr:hypothetical protein [Desulfobulbaceae bacterium]
MTTFDRQATALRTAIKMAKLASTPTTITAIETHFRSILASEEKHRGGSGNCKLGCAVTSHRHGVSSTMSQA